MCASYAPFDLMYYVFDCLLHLIVYYYSYFEVLFLITWFNDTVSIYNYYHYSLLIDVRLFVVTPTSTTLTTTDY